MLLDMAALRGFSHYSLDGASPQRVPVPGTPIYHYSDVLGVLG